LISRCSITQHRLRCLNEVPRHKDRLCLLRRTASAANCSPVRSQVCSPVTSDVSCSDAARLRKCNSRRHSAVSAQSTSVGDDLCCSAGVLIVAVRPCQPTPPALQGSKLTSSSLSLSTNVSMEQYRRALPMNLASWRTSSVDVVYVPPHHRR